MPTVILSYNSSNAIAVSLIDSVVKSGAFKIEEESPYNPEFVKKIAKSRKSRGKAIKTEDLWK